MAKKGKNNLFHYKHKVGKTQDGKAIRKSFYSSKSLKDAKSKAEEYVEKLKLQLPTSKIIFSEWCDFYIDNYKRDFIKASTLYNDWLSPIKKHIKPYFGNYMLSEITSVLVQKFIGSKMADYSPNSIGRFKMILCALFEQAIENDLIFKNPAKNVKIPRIENIIEKRNYSSEEVRRIIDYCKLSDSNLAPQIITLLKTGIRRGELLTLLWTDINLDDNIIDINKAVSESREGLEVGKPKTACSIRLIPFDEELSAILSELNRNSKLVFPNLVGKLYMPSSWQKRYNTFMTNMCTELELYDGFEDEPQTKPKLKKLSAHELRHTCGTLLREKGIDIYTIQKILGHADIKMTSQKYVHNDLEVLKKSMEKSFSQNAL